MKVVEERGQNTKKPCSIIYLLSKSQKSPVNSKLHIRLSSLCQQLVQMALIPNLWHPFSEGGPAQIQRPYLAFRVAHCWLQSVVVFLSLSPNSKPIEEERDERGSTLVPIKHNSWLPTWLIKSEIRSHCADSLIQIILSLLICSICFVPSFPCCATGCNVKLYNRVCFL